MSITPVEHDAIVNEIWERMTVRMVEIVSNLMMNSAEVFKLNKDLYKDHPEFKEHIDSVRSVLKKLEEENPGVAYVDLIKQAVPLIKDRIKTIAPLDIEKVAKRNDLNLNIPMDSNGDF